MCGIFGWWVRDEVMSLTQRAILAALLADANLVRGRDSWGYYRPQTDELVRGLGSIVRKAAVGLAESPIVMAHTRSATTGKITIDNAHPFDFGTVIGAHNGMVNNHAELNVQYNRNFDVDSMHIFAHLAAGLPLREVSGWGAIEYYRRDRSRMFLSAFGGQLGIFGIGPQDGACQGVVWSSSDYQLEGALETIGVEYYPFLTRDGELYCIKDYNLWRVGPFEIARFYDATERHRRARYDYTTTPTRQVGAVVGNQYVPAVSQARLPIINPKAANSEARKPWVNRLPGESRKQFRRRRREILDKWEAAQAEAAQEAADTSCCAGDADDELVAEVVQDAVSALKDRRIEDGLVLIEQDPCV